MNGFAGRRHAAFALALLTIWLAQGAVAPPGHAQDKHLDGFLGIAFGASLAEARAQLLEHQGITLDPVHSDANTLVLDGGVFGGEAVGFWLLGFVDDRMHTARAVIQPEEARLMATYRALVALFTEQYGPPDTHHGFFDEPYEAGDGFETYAIRFGKGHFAALWRFSDGAHENVISLSISEDLYIPIIYQSGRLIDLAIARQHADGAGL